MVKTQQNEFLEELKQLTDTFKTNQANQSSFVNSHQITLSNIWSPDNPGTGTFEDLEAVLLACKANGTFQSDSNIIFLYLSDNMMLNRLGDLTSSEKSSLTSFIAWLKKYCYIDSTVYKEKFKLLKQSTDQSYRTFYLNLV